MRPHDPKDEEPLDLGLFEMMMGMTPDEWDGAVKQEGASQQPRSEIVRLAGFSEEVF